MSIRPYAGWVLRLSPGELLRRGNVFVSRKLALARQRRLDADLPTYVDAPDSYGDRLETYLPAVPIELLGPRAHEISALSELYLSHCFDLLGSGWIRVKHGMHSSGLECHIYRSTARNTAQLVNPPNRRYSERVLNLIEGEYEPIDWHIDFKSGYRWSPQTWYLDAAFGRQPGVDIKVPWELSRMQHLPVLAWAHALAREEQRGFTEPDAYVREFRNQVLDFIGHNPPRFGVNWRTSMDVGIRVANWLVAFDLFSAYGARFDTEFQSQLGRSVYQHAQHILTNLEWSPDIRGNHYLADVVGLLFAAAYLPSNPETDAWLAFAVQELIGEVEHQFNPDGSNFEASTSYHRLSGEMVVYATALVLGLGPHKRAALRHYDLSLHIVHPPLRPAPIAHHALAGTHLLTPFPTWYMERVERMAEFTLYSTKPNARVPQIGDNDSGRFLKVWPRFYKMAVSEARDVYASLDHYEEQPDTAVHWFLDDLDHRHLVAAVNGLFDRADFATFAGEAGLETLVVRQFAGGVRFPSYRKDRRAASETVRIGIASGWANLRAQLESSVGGWRSSTEIAIAGDDICQGVVLRGFPDFGLFIFESARVYLCLRCGSIGQDGNGGHAHADQLSIELNVDGQDWIADPGTYLYTALPARRNEYRAAMAHSGPLVAGREPENLNLGPFRLSNFSRAECLYFGDEGFIGRHRGYGPWVYRVVELFPNLIRVTDYADGDLQLLAPLPEVEAPAFSPAYGVRFRDARWPARNRARSASD